MNRPNMRPLSRRILQINGGSRLPRPHRRQNHTEQTPSQDRLSRIRSRTPAFLHPYLLPLYNAPVSHITAFLILHELTAVLPLFFFAGIFHYTDILPRDRVAEWSWVKTGLGRWERYARRKGWISPEEVEMQVSGESETEARENVELVLDEGRDKGDVGKRDVVKGDGMRVVLELATAWAITKALLPVRLGVSVWGTPWFARVVLGPVGRFVGKAVKR